jgi:3-dehydroquinate dehydratase-2
MPVAKLLLINGPNLNLLGTREPEIYGSTTLTDVEQMLSEQAAAAGHSLDCFQSNHEGAIVDALHDARGQVDFVIINPGAYTHTSIAIRDAFSATQLPFIEVHLSNIHAREPFREHSHLSAIARGIIMGLGVNGYQLALAAAIEQIKVD